MIRNFLCGVIPRGSQWEVMLGRDYKNICLSLHRNLHSVNLSPVLAPTDEERFDATTNPNGIVNLGTGTNYLMQSQVSSKVSQLRASQTILSGPENVECRENETSQVVATFMTKFFKASTPVQPEQLKVLYNVTLGVDLLGTFLGKPHDVLLCPAPAYSRLFKGCTQYSALEVVPVPLPHDAERGKYFCLSASTLEKAILEQMAQGKCVRGIIVNNPNNPSGEVYSPHLILEIMDLCHRYNIHIIVSEVYCLSVFDETCKFTSVLELSKIPDPEKTHVLWGLTKDLCLTDFHAAVVYSADTLLMSKIQNNPIFTGVPMTDQVLLTMYINDHEWIENDFLVKNHERMKRAYLRTREKLESLDIEVYPSSAGFFLLCNFKQILRPATEKNCIEMFKLLNRNGVYVVPYWEMRCWEPGWFRIVFTAEDHIFDAGFDRIKQAVDDWKNYKVNEN